MYTEAASSGPTNARTASPLRDAQRRSRHRDASLGIAVREPGRVAGQRTHHLRIGDQAAQRLQTVVCQQCTATRTSSNGGERSMEEASLMVCRASRAAPTNTCRS